MIDPRRQHDQNYDRLLHQDNTDHMHCFWGVIGQLLFGYRTTTDFL